MAPKKAAASGFWSFAMDYRKKNGPNMTLPEVTQRAGEIWQTMSAVDKKRWDDFAKNGPQQQFKRKPVEKFTSQGIPISQIDKEQALAERTEKNMKNQIQDIIDNASNTKGIENEKFIFISVNYFTKSIEGKVYLPAEVSLSEYSLKDGITRKYHCYINPGEIMFGHAFAAKQHTEATHNLPLPPKALGESDLDKIYQQILDFVKRSNKQLGETVIPPIYTHKEQMQATESVLNFLKSGMGCKINLEVYSIHYLFYALKMATCAQGGIIKPDTIFTTDAYFDRDEFEYHVGIGCKQHEEMDRSKYCTLSCVVRWGFMFSDYMCCDLDLDMTPGVHIPKDTNCGTTFSTSRSFIDDSQSFHSDTESYASFTSDGTGVTKPRGRAQFAFANKDINANGSIVAASAIEDMNDSVNFVGKIPSTNRWAERNKVQAREPSNDTLLEMNSTLNSSLGVTRRGRYAAVLAARTAMSMEDDNSIYEVPSLDSSRRSCGRGRLFD